MPDNALTLGVEDSGLATLVFDAPNKSVNVFNRAVIDELGALVDRLAERSDIRCLVLLSGKRRNFIAGADVDEIARITDGKVIEEAVLTVQGIFSKWEALPFPTVAAVRGTCMGGGTEISLASDYIAISDRPDVRIGLPETQLGIIPAWGGCVRLPRKVGLTAALDVILAGKSLRPKKAFKTGLADALLPDASFLAEVRRFAELVIADKAPRPRKADFKRRLLESNPIGRKVVFDQARKQTLKKTAGNYPAPVRAIEVIATGLADGAKAGFAAEARAEVELAVSPVCKNLVHLFHLMEGAKRRRADAPAVGKIESMAVLGAGIMGGGIAQIVADKADLEVRLKDINDDALAQGLSVAAGLFRKQIKRRWISKGDAARKMALIRPSLGYSGFGRTDLVIEAVVERLDIKRKVFADLEQVARPDAVLATNTSSISIDLISAEMERPERCIGIHFFNPVSKMPLIEVISGTKTSAEAAQTAVDFARSIGKTPVVVKDGPGFLVNRLLGFTMAESLWLLDDGHSIEDLDRAVRDWGMPMGPATLIDEVGIDTAAHVGKILVEAFSDRLAFPEWFDKMVEDGRLGTKAGRGFYTYVDGKRREPDQSVYGLLGLEPNVANPDPARMIDRVMLPMVNEAARCLDEGVVGSAGDLDLAMILGTGFPPFRGGLCRWADQQGLGQVKEALEGLAQERGERYRPSAALERAIQGGGFYETFG